VFLKSTENTGFQAHHYKWRDRFLESAKEGLENGKKSKVKQFEEKIEEFQKVIGKQTIVIETLKNSNISRQRETVALLVDEGFNVSRSSKVLENQPEHVLLQV